MKTNMQEVLKENREREWQRRRELIKQIETQQKINTILTILIGMFIVWTTIVIVMNMSNRYHQYDVNRDGIVDAVDYVNVYKYIMDN